MSDHKGLLEALFAAQAEFPAIQKTNANDFFNSKFASFKDEKQAIDPILRRHGLFVTQPLSNVDGKPALRTRVVHVASGEFLEDVVPLVLAKSDPQALGSATSYTKRYAYEALLGLITTDDDDGHQASHADPKALEAAHTRVVDAAKRLNLGKAAVEDMFFKKYGVKLSVSQDVSAVNALADHLTEKAVAKEMA
jgi:hypothetical protein